MKYRDRIAIFTKSYKPDLDRCRELSKSISKYNVDRIPYYISVPKEDVQLFQKEIPYYRSIISDDEISEKNMGWNGQQLVKARFYKTEIAQFYFSVDSDNLFIKDFDVNDLMYDEGIPYMVMNENRDLFEWFDRYGSEFYTFDIRETLHNEYQRIMRFLGRHGKIYHFGPGPFIWNSEVWRKADEEFGLEDLFSLVTGELKWYGELALYYDVEYLPTKPICKAFHYREQYEWYKQLGWTIDMFRKQYIALGLQSNWNAPLKY